MKLGDNMAAVKACNVWGDVCPRKVRPPHIGEIPRHVTVDEESPSSSSIQLPVKSPELTKSMLDISCPVSHGDTRIYVSQDLHEKSHNTLATTVSPAIKTDTISLSSLTKQQQQQHPKCLITADGHFSSLPISRKESLLSRDKTTPEIPIDIQSKILSLNEKLTKEIVTFDDKKNSHDNAKIIWQKEKKPSEINNENAVDKMTFEYVEWELNTPSSSKNKIMTNHLGDGKIESGVRKDSAIYLEDNDEYSEIIRLKEITENEISQRVPSSMIAVSGCEDEIENLEIDDQMMLLNGKKGQSRYCRPRRESSGYMSNLSTFDEERKNSMTGDMLQGIQGLQFIKERRRSSTKKFNASRLMKEEEEESDMPDIEEVKESSRDNSTSLKTKPEESNNISEISRLSGVKSEIIDNSDVKKIQNLDAESVKITNPKFKITTNVDEIVQHGTSASSSPRSRQRKRIIHQYSSPSSSSSLELERIPEKSCITLSRESAENEKKKNQEMTVVIVDDDDDDDVFVGKKTTSNDCKLKNSSNSKNILPKSIKVYQLLSTQSEDRGDGEPRLMDRRISLQINQQDDDEELPISSLSLMENKQLIIQSDASSHLKIPDEEIKESSSVEEVNRVKGLPSMRKLSSPGEVGVVQRFVNDNAAVGLRPIYPYCPYSPYGSPQGSPGTKRRPLRESRRVSIDNRQGALQLNQYKLLDNIGQGSFGIVKLAYNEEDDTHYAMKILSKKKLMKKAGIFGRMAPGRKSVTNPLAKVYREIALLKKLDHPNVVKLVEVLDDPDEDNLYLVFELVQRGEVLQLPTDKPLDEETARTNFRDVVMGVEYLHYQRIVHRDIKPSNLLVDSDGRVKVADLGVSAELRASGELLSGSAGTPAFAAPETTIPGAQYSGTLCDVWSMGVTLYSLVTGKVPWDGAGSIIGVQAAVRTEPLHFPDKPIISDDLRDLITRMLTKDPLVRINLENIKIHPWLTKDGKEPLPSETDNCRLPVTVTDEEIARVVTRVPKLDTLILIKTMLKQHSFQNPFLPRRIVKPSSNETINSSIKTSSAGDCNVSQCRDSAKSKTEQFHKAGRSNSAPDSYDWQTNGRQVSFDSPLTPVSEVEIEKR